MPPVGLLVTSSKSVDLPRRNRLGGGGGGVGGGGVGGGGGGVNNSLAT